MRRAIIIGLELAVLTAWVQIIETSSPAWAQTKGASQGKGAVQNPGQNPAQNPGLKGFPAQPMPGQPGYYGYGQAPWFASSAAQKQLNLTNDQLTKMNQAYGENWNQYSKGLAGIGAPNDPQRNQKMQELSNKLNGQMMQSAQGTLKPDQLQRFQQLNLQHQGLNAFNDPAVQKQLNLNSDQINRLNELNMTQSKTLGNIYNQYSTNPKGAATEFQNFRRQYDDQLNSILTEPQRQAWRQMVGEPHDFTPMPFQNQKK